MQPTAVQLVREARALVFALEEQAYRGYSPGRSQRLAHIATMATQRLRRRIRNAAQELNAKERAYDH